MAGAAHDKLDQIKIPFVEVLLTVLWTIEICLGLWQDAHTTSTKRKRVVSTANNHSLALRARIERARIEIAMILINSLA